jgi:hypothetical protein
LNLWGQTYPFPRNFTYPYGFNQTVESATASSARAQTWYNSWRSNYVTNCGSYSLVRNSTSGSNSFSEGQGYGMLLAAYQGDKALFDRLWAGYRQYRNSNGLMHWQVSCSGIINSNGATDGDLDAAMALLIAEAQWPTATSPYDYGAEATTLITAIYNYETNLPGNAGGHASCTGPGGISPFYVLRPGDAFQTGTTCTCINISYFAPAYYRAFAQHIPSQASAWNTLADHSYALINANKNSSTHLVSAWARSNGTVPAPNSAECSYSATGGAGPDAYQYDAARTPWRIATDYLWWGTPAADTWLTQVGNWAQSKGVNNIFTNYDRATGNPSNSDRNSAFYGAFVLSQSAVSQSQLNSWYQNWITKTSLSGYNGSDRLDDGPYYQNSLAVMYMFLASGNFWNPYGAVCRTPNLGADRTTCGTGFPVLLNSNTPTASNVTFTWKRHSPSPTTLVNASTTQTTYSVSSANGPGTYVVVRDSLTCQRTDTIIISSTLPTPALGSDLVICSPSSYNLAPSNLASFPPGTNWQWSLGGTNIAGATNSTLANVRVAGTYRLTASIAGCTATFDEVVLTSNLPTPVDGCASSGSIALSITNATGGPYQWYSTPTGGTSLATGLTYNAPAAGTYFVQDMSAVGGSVGPTTLLADPTNWGINAGNHMRFSITSSITITSVRVPFNVYGNSSGAISVEVLDNNGNPLSPNRIFTSNSVNVTAGNGQLITFSFPSFTINSAWGTNLRLRLTSKGTINGDPLWNDSGALYPYNSTPSGIMTITGGAGGNGQANDYFYFYNIQFQSGTPCDRLPVVAANIGCTLPVDWISQSATKLNDEQIKVTWITANEVNNNYFEVQRSNDGENFKTLTKVNSTGASSGLNVYEYIDREVSSGLFYYRIRQVDLDGKESYSALFSTMIVSDNVEWKLYPNPSTTYFNLESNHSDTKLYEAYVINSLGQVVEIIEISPLVTAQSYQFGSLLPTGSYILRLLGNNYVKNISFVKN